jgi:DNA-binding transcriptional regulator YbjK
VPSTRQRALDAAVSIVSEHGMRALTHARIDAAAGLPRGSTSNSFRTRSALIEGLIDWIAEGERTDLPAYDFADADSFISALTRLIEVQTTEHAERTKARFTLFLEADAAALAPLRAQRRRFEEWMASAAGALHMTDAPAAARTLLACGSGLVMHRLTVDPDVAVRPVVERAVRGCLAV